MFWVYNIIGSFDLAGVYFCVQKKKSLIDEIIRIINSLWNCLKILQTQICSQNMFFCFFSSNQLWTRRLQSLSLPQSFGQFMAIKSSPSGYLTAQKKLLSFYWICQYKNITYILHICVTIFFLLVTVPTEREPQKSWDLKLEHAVHQN